MTTRFSLYSYLEDIEKRTLVLTNPFVAARHSRLLCRYETLRQGPDSLVPDPAYEGLASWHAYLPLSSEQIDAVNRPYWSVTPCEAPGSDQLAACWQIAIDPTLPWAIALPLLEETQTQSAFAFGLDRSVLQLQAILPTVKLKLFSPEGGSTDTTPSLYNGSVYSAWLEARALPDLWADLGPWGNPYRLEAYRALGLDLAARHVDTLPTLIVDDPTGEITTGLILASELVATFYPGRTPYRLVVLQHQPFDCFARLFEGTKPDLTCLEAPNNSHALWPPEPMPRMMVQGVQRLLGTVLSLEPTEDQDTSVQARALARLLRTHFIDDEDTVYFIR